MAKTTTHYALVQSHAQRWQAAEQEVEARLALYRFGQSQVNVVLQSQQRRADAQISYYRALAEYNKSINYVDYLKGTMLANSNITLAEGPWNKKAYWDALERARERSAGRKVQYGVSRPGVIRRGPLADADAAATIIGSGTSTFGATMPPEGVILDGAVTDPLGLNLQPDREAVDVNSIPLREMGSTSGEMLGPEVPQSRPATPEALPLPLPDSVPVPAPDEARHAPPTNDVNHRVDTVNYVTDVEISNAPQPVRRIPIPSR